MEKWRARTSTMGNCNEDRSAREVSEKADNLVDATSGEDGNGEEESEDMHEKQVVEEEHVKPIKAEDADAEDADFRFAIAWLRDASPSKSPTRTDRMAPQPHDSVAPSLSRPYGTSNGFVPHVWSTVSRSNPAAGPGTLRIPQLLHWIPLEF